MKKFSFEENGYNREEVTQFMKEIENSSEEMKEKYKQQEEKIESLEEEISYYQKWEASLREIIEQEQSKKILEDAKKDASEIINDALLRAQEVEKQRILLERNMNLFKKKLKLIMQQQMAVVEKIDELEIEDK